MINYNLDIASIEAFLYDAINGKVSKNTFTGLPDTTKASWKDMCLVDCGNAINDMRSYGRGSVMIWLYSKPLSDGSKDTRSMAKLERSLDEIIKGLRSDKFAISIRSKYNDYDSDRKWYCTIVILNIIVY